MADSEELGAGTGRQGPWTRDEDDRADKQRGDPHSLDVEGDPRGGVQSDEYRHADPRDIVIEGDTAMAGPGGTPQEDDRSIDERREDSADMRDRSVTNPPPPQH
jgi:hypothetical protein